METNTNIWQKVPAGIAGLIAVLLLIYSVSPWTLGASLILILLEFILGLVKNKNLSQLSMLNTQAQNQITALNAEMEIIQYAQHSLHMIGKLNMPI